MTMNQSKLGLFKRLVSIAKPYWFSKEKKGAWLLLSGLLLLLVGINILNITINYVAGSYMTALQEKDAVRDSMRNFMDVVRVRLNDWQGRYNPLS